MIAHLDGKPMPAPLPGLWSGRGVYETFLWYGNLPNNWLFHVQRCRRGALAWHLPLPDEAELVRAVRDLGAAHQALPLRMRLTVLGNDELSRGYSLLAQARPLTTAERDLPPARVVLGGCVRNPASLLVGCKRLCVAEDLAWRDKARALGADDTLLCSTDGLIAEASTSSVLFGLDGGRIATPGAQAAPVWGTTLAALRIQVPEINEISLRSADMPRVRWALLLNAVVGARSVSHIEGRELAQPPADLIALAKSLTDKPATGRGT